MSDCDKINCPPRQNFRLINLQTAAYYENRDSDKFCTPSQCHKNMALKTKYVKLWTVHWKTELKRLDHRHNPMLSKSNFYFKTMLTKILHAKKKISKERSSLYHNTELCYPDFGAVPFIIIYNSIFFSRIDWYTFKSHFIYWNWRFQNYKSTNNPDTKFSVFYIHSLVHTHF